MDCLKAVVQAIIPQGKHGPFAVATSEGLDGSVTFSLEPTVWKEAEWPEEGMCVFLANLRQKRAGWRAKLGRFWKLSDEQGAKKMTNTTVVEVLTHAYEERWTSRDVREGACPLEVCHGGKGRFYKTWEVLVCIFGGASPWADLSRHVCATQGKVAAEEAKVLWAEWQRRTGKFGKEWAYEFIRDIGLPIHGGLIVKGEVYSPSAGITEEIWQQAVAKRTVYLAKEIDGHDVFIVCRDCCKDRQDIRTRETSANEVDAEMQKLVNWGFAPAYFPVRRPERDCPHVKQ